MMRRIEVSGQRRLMLRFFHEPSSDPYVSITMDVNLEPALALLDAFARDTSVRAGVQHLVTAAVARCLHELPELNRKIVAKRFYQLERVDVAVPVRLAGKSSNGDQTGMMVLQGVERMTLAEIASETRIRTRAERAGDLRTSGSAFGRRLASALPFVVEKALGAAGTVLQHPLGYRLLGPWSSLSTGITNVGAVFTLPEGARFRSVALTMPGRLGHVASAFALAPATDAPVAEGGRSTIRRVLPITMLVDHRLIDGYLMAKLGERLASALLAPESLVRALC